MQIKIDDLTDSRIADFLNEHMQDMKSVSPPESIHALDLAELQKPEVTFWSVWVRGELVGCGALKSMRTSNSKRQSGIGSFILNNILSEAKQRGYQSVSLETGSMSFFEPAQRLYSKFGFKECGPFANYKNDPNSIFMRINLADP